MRDPTKVVDPRQRVLELFDDPAAALRMDRCEAATLLAIFEGRSAVLRARLASPDAVHQNGREATETNGRALLTPRQAAELLSLSVKQLYRRVDRLPGVVRLGPRTLRFDRDKFQALARSQGRTRGTV